MPSPIIRITIVGNAIKAIAAIRGTTKAAKDMGRAVDGTTAPMARAGRAADGYRSRMRRARDELTKFQTHARRITLPSIIGLAGVIPLFAAAGQAAAVMADSVDATRIIFGSAKKAVVDFATTAAANFGISKQTALDQANAVGQIGRIAGFTGQALANMATTLVARGGDLAALFGGKAVRAVEAIRSGLVSQVRPLRAYGVFLDVASLKAEAFRLGLVKAKHDVSGMKLAQDRLAFAQQNYAETLRPASERQIADQRTRVQVATTEAAAAVQKYGARSVQAASATVRLHAAQDTLLKLQSGFGPSSKRAQAALLAVEGAQHALEVLQRGNLPGILTPAQRTKAAISIILRQSNIAKGNFLQTRNFTKNIEETTTATFANLKASLGASLLPLFNTLLKAVLKLFDTIQKHQTGFKQLLIGVGAVAGLIALSNVVSAIGTAVAFLGSPLGLVVLGLSGLALILHALGVTPDDVKRFLMRISNALSSVHKQATGLSDWANRNGGWAKSLLVSGEVMTGLLLAAPAITAVTGAVRGLVVAESIGALSGAALLGPLLLVAAAGIVGFELGLHVLGPILRRIGQWLASIAEKVAVLFGPAGRAMIAKAVSDVVFLPARLGDAVRHFIGWIGGLIGAFLGNLLALPAKFGDQVIRFLGWLAGLVGAFFGWLGTLGSKSLDAIFGWLTDVGRKFSGLVSFFGHIGSIIATFAGNMWKPIGNAFIDTLDWLIRAWNWFAAHFRLPGIGPIGFSGVFLPTIPQIPKLSGGGIITKQTLALLHPNEAVIPLDHSFGNTYILEVHVDPAMDPAAVGRGIVRTIEAHERATGARRLLPVR